MFFQILLHPRSLRGKSYKDGSQREHRRTNCRWRLLLALPSVFPSDRRLCNLWREDSCLHYCGLRVHRDGLHLLANRCHPVHLQPCSRSQHHFKTGTCSIPFCIPVHTLLVFFTEGTLEVAQDSAQLTTKPASSQLQLVSLAYNLVSNI